RVVGRAALAQDAPPPGQCPGGGAVFARVDGEAVAGSAGVWQELPHEAELPALDVEEAVHPGVVALGALDVAADVATLAEVRHLARHGGDGLMALDPERRVP